MLQETSFKLIKDRKVAACQVPRLTICVKWISSLFILRNGIPKKQSKLLKSDIVHLFSLQSHHNNTIIILKNIFAHPSSTLQHHVSLPFWMPFSLCYTCINGTQSLILHFFLHTITVILTWATFIQYFAWTGLRGLI